MKKQIKRILARVFPAVFCGISTVARFVDRSYALSLSGKFRSIGNGLDVSFPSDFIGMNCISLGDGFSSGKFLRMEAISKYRGQSFSPEIRIGSNFTCLNFVHIGCVSRIDIGDNVLVGSHVTIVDHNHGNYGTKSLEKHEDPKVPPLDRKLSMGGDVFIGDNVWIGEGATILSGSNIGSGVIVGANAIISGSIPDNTIVAANSATLRKKYNYVNCKWERC